MKAILRVLALFLLSLAAVLTPQLPAQDWLYTGTNLGAGKIRLAAADFKPVASDPQFAAAESRFRFHAIQ
jgi:TolB protein